MKSVVFYVDKETGNFKSYQIFDKPYDVLDFAIKNFNLEIGNNKVAYVVTNKHVIDAIVQKETWHTISSRVDEVLETLYDFRSQIVTVSGSVENLITFAKKHINEKKEI